MFVFVCLYVTYKHILRQFNFNLTGAGNHVMGAKAQPDTHHYTFDFSQCVSLPHYSRQVGPLYFLTLRKVQIFGFRISGGSS